MVKKKLESKGVVFGEYYNNIIIHSSGERDPRFFRPSNSGSYTIYVFSLPDDFYVKSIDEDNVSKFLNE